MIRSTLAGLLAATLTLGPAPARAGDPGIRGWMTTADGKQRLAPMSGLGGISSAQKSDTVEIRVDTKRRFQRMEGFGAAITDASAWLIQQRLTPQARQALLEELFSQSRGVGFSVTRLPIGASDFSMVHYSLADRPGDPVARIDPLMRDVLPTLREMRRINSGLKIIASPWSAPAWMKDSSSLIKGRLKPESHGDFARYLVSFAKAMQREGVGIDLLTIQNEPHFEPANYPGMRVEPVQRAAFIAGHLGPMMAREIPRVRLLDWDHNWDEPQSPEAVLGDPRAARYVSGTAWHCYAGDVQTQSRVHDRFPKKETWFTECSAGKWSGDWGKSFAWSVRNLVIGAPRNWAKGVMMWNLALDEKDGPHLGGCGDCRGLVTIDRASGKVTREPEFYAFAHASRFVRPGAVRVASESGMDKVETVAFQHGASGKVALIVRNGADEARTIRVLQGIRNFVATLPAGAVATLTWNAG